MNNTITITLKLMLCVLISTQSITVLAQSIRYSGFYDWENGAEILKDPIQLNDGSILVVGNTAAAGPTGFAESFNVVINSDGDTLYTQVYGKHESNVIPQAVVGSRYTSSIYAAGYICDFFVDIDGQCDYYFSKLDDTGDTLFTKVINRPDTGDFVLDLVETRPNKLMLIGWTYDDTTNANANADLMFITVDTLGNELNRVIWGGVGTDYVHSGLVINENGDVLMTGWRGDDSWLVKTDSIGNVAGPHWQA